MNYKKIHKIKLTVQVYVIKQNDSSLNFLVLWPTEEILTKFCLERLN